MKLLYAEDEISMSEAGISADGASDAESGNLSSDGRDACQGLGI